MALIGKIRKNGWLLVVLVGRGLAAFILMDMSSGDKSVFGSQATVMAEIEGKKIGINEFNRTDQLIRDQLYRNSGADGLALRNSLWNFMVEETLVNKEADAIGIGVSKAEMDELRFGTNVSPIITSHFRDQTTNQVNRTLVNQYRDYRNGTTPWPNDQTRDWWAHEEQEIIKDSKQTKLINLVSKSMYTPSWMAEMIGQNQNRKVDMALVSIPYDQIDNGSITVSDADYNAYMKENGAQYKNNVETRKVNYVTFDLEASAADKAEARAKVEKWTTDWATTTNDTTFVDGKGGYLDAKLFTQDQLSAGLKDTIFDYGVGSLYGPFEEDNFFKTVKVLEKKTIPDSVSARHILIKVDNATATQPIVAQAYSLVDSLKTLLDGGADFATLATEFSEDASNASKGGDLGYFAQGRMVGPFNDMAFFNLNKGEYEIVGTQFGFHIVKVTGQKFINDNQGIRLGYVSEPILPSENTINAFEDKVALFIEANPTIESLQKSVAADASLEIKDAASLKRNDFFFADLGSGQVSRDIIKWAYGDTSPGASDVGDVSPEIYRYQTNIDFGGQSYFYDNKYVVAALGGVQPAGIPSVAFIKSEIEDAVYNMKKAAFVQESLGGSTDLSAIAAKYTGAKVDTLANVNFGTTFLPAPIQKSEPKVIAEAFNAEINSVSKAIDGTEAIYILMPTGKPNNETPVNIANVQRSQNQTAGSFARARLMQALKDGADMSDNRASFF